MSRPDTSTLVPLPADRELLLTSFDGTKLHVEIRGADHLPTVVMVHGWTLSSDYWTRQYAALSGRYRMVSYDQRGHGRSGEPGSAGFDPEALPGDLAAVVEACVPAGERAIFVGHSMGAMTIVGAAGQQPALIAERAAGAVLASTGVDELIVRNRIVPLPMPLGKVFKQVSAAVLSTSVRLRPRTGPVSRFVVRYVSLGAKATKAEIEFTTALVLGCDSRVRGRVGRMLADLDLSPNVPDLTVPTVVVAGTKDRLTPIWHARRLAELLPDCLAMIEVPGVGHMTPLEAADVVVEAVDRVAALREAPAALAG